MYYMRSPLTGHLFLLFRGSLTQRGKRRLVATTEVHLCGRHEGQIFDLTAQLGLLFAREHHVPFCRWPQGNRLLWGFLTAQLSLIRWAWLKLGFLGAKLGTFAPWFLDFSISKTRFPVCAKKIIKELMLISVFKMNFSRILPCTIFITVAWLSPTKPIGRGQHHHSLFILPLLTFAISAEREWSS